MAKRVTLTLPLSTFAMVHMLAVMASKKNVEMAMVGMQMGVLDEATKAQLTAEIEQLNNYLISVPRMEEIHAAEGDDFSIVVPDDPKDNRAYQEKLATIMRGGMSGH